MTQRRAPERQAYDSIDWVTIFLFAGMIPLASAMNTSGAENESIRRSTYRTCESTGGCDKNRHENSPRGRADLGCQSDAHRAEERFGSGIAHELRQDNGQDEEHRGDDIGRRISAETRGIYCGNPRGMAFLPELRGVWQYD